jgi:hypothetical protein
MSQKFRDALFLMGLALSVRCGGRVIDEAVRAGEADAGRGQGPGSTGGDRPGSTSGGRSTSGGDTSSVVTGGVTSGGIMTSGAGGATTTTSTTTIGIAGSGGYGGAPGMGGFGGMGGFAGATILCTSAPIPGTDQQITCKRTVGSPPLWSCACGMGGQWTYCTAKGDMPCGAVNCCGFDTSKATGCAATPPTLPPVSGCVDLIRQQRELACAHITQLNVPGYGPFTSCCPPGAPFSCPTGTPNACFATAEQARANCKDYCVQCVPAMF